MSTYTLNKMLLIGNLVKDPDFRPLDGNNSVCHMVVATERRWKSSDGKNHEETFYHRVVAWQKMAEVCRDVLKKGSKAYFQGRLNYKEFTTKSGDTAVATEIVVEEMISFTRKDVFEQDKEGPQITD